MPTISSRSCWPKPKRRGTRRKLVYVRRGWVEDISALAAIDGYATVPFEARRPGTRTPAKTVTLRPPQISALCGPLLFLFSRRRATGAACR